MRLKFTLLIAVFLLTSSLAAAKNSQPSEWKPFNFSSFGSGFGVQAELEGSYLIHDDSIEVKVNKVTLYVSETCPYQGRRSIERLKFGLATEAGAKPKWKLSKAGQPINLALVMSPSDKYSLYDLYFVIPRDTSVDLLNSWFVVEIQTDELDLPVDDRRKGFVFASSCRDIFSSDLLAMR